jgi:hypothetical protein
MSLFRKIILLVEDEQMDERELASIIGSHPDNHGLMRAIFQLIAQAERESNYNAAGVVQNHAECSKHLGGADAMQLLRGRILELRELGRKGQ